MYIIVKIMIYCSVNIVSFLPLSLLIFHFFKDRIQVIMYLSGHIFIIIINIPREYLCAKSGG